MSFYSITILIVCCVKVVKGVKGVKGVKVGGSPTMCEFRADKLLEVVKIDASHSTFNSVGGNQTNETVIDG